MRISRKVNVKTTARAVVIVFLLLGAVGCPVDHAAGQFTIIADYGFHPSVAQSGADIWLGYSTYATEYEYICARSPDRGATWPETQRSTIAGVDSHGASLAVSGTVVYTLYNESSSGNLFFSRSTDSGATWPPANIRTIHGTAAHTSSLVVNGTDVYACFFSPSSAAGADFFFALSADGGDTWSTPTAVDESAVIIGDYCTLAFDGENLYIAYGDTSNNRLKMAFSDDEGEHWTLTDVDAGGNYASCAYGNGAVCISYMGGTDWHPKFARSTNQGADWTISDIDTAATDASYTSLAVQGSGVFVAYKDENGDKLRFARSDNNGATFSAMTIDDGSLTYSQDVGTDPKIGVDGSQMFIVYEDSYHGHLRIARSTNGGADWF